MTGKLPLHSWSSPRARFPYYVCGESVVCGNSVLDVTVSHLCRGQLSFSYFVIHCFTRDHKYRNFCLVSISTQMLRCDDRTLCLKGTPCRIAALGVRPEPRGRPRKESCLPGSCASGGIVVGVMIFQKRCAALDGVPGKLWSSLITYTWGNWCVLTRHYSLHQECLVGSQCSVCLRLGSGPAW